MAASSVMHEVSRKYYEECKISKLLYENDSLKKSGLRKVNEAINIWMYGFTRKRCRG